MHISITARPTYAPEPNPGTSRRPRRRRCPHHLSRQLKAFARIVKEYQARRVEARLTGRAVDRRRPWKADLTPVVRDYIQTVRRHGPGGATGIYRQVVDLWEDGISLGEIGRAIHRYATDAATRAQPETARYSMREFLTADRVRAWAVADVATPPQSEAVPAIAPVRGDDGHQLGGPRDRRWNGSNRPEGEPRAESAVLAPGEWRREMAAGGQR